MTTIHRQQTARTRRTAAARSLRTHELFDLIPREDGATRRRLLDEVVEVNIPVADSLAARYAARGIPSDDLVQVARLALVKVAGSFRPELGGDFLSYAVPSIRGELRRHFRDAGWMVRPPRRVQEAEYRVNGGRAELVQALGREPSPEEIAREVGLDPDTVSEVLTLDGCFTPDSLDKTLPVGDGGTSSLGDRLGADDDGFDLIETRAVLAPLVADLEERDRQVVRLRFVEGLTQREVGDRIGVTQMQVSRILARILAELRDRLTDDTGLRAA